MLNLYNIGQTYTQWIEAFLRDWKQQVLVNDDSSEWKDVSSGIPQGSVMGPILFVLYINELPSSISSQSDIFLFADDTKIFKEVYNIEDSEQLQSDIYLMNDWSEKWLLKVHPEKCKTMRIGSSKVESYDYKQGSSKPRIFGRRHVSVQAI